ncbi:hypothetical protein T01_13314 [Trichinella spiralis]|uniref:Uncharacterized protein n=1 Tax=Trichinella spiralis TaxID=6334 RepID=A0A0V1AXD3_TRISP|nr:hypothetical protein T01_13314 [Trichinella spiralis]
MYVRMGVSVGGERKRVAVDDGAVKIEKISRPACAKGNFKTLFAELIDRHSTRHCGDVSAAAPYTVKKIDANSASHNRTRVFPSPLSIQILHTLDSHAKSIE